MANYINLYYSKKNNWISEISYLSIALVILYSFLIFDYQYSFTYLIEFNKHSYLLLTCVLLFILSEIQTINNSSLLVKILVLIPITIIYAFYPELIHNEHLIVSYSFIFVLFTLINLSKNCIVFILIGTQLILFLELCIVIFQLTTNQITHYTSSVYGTFNNSGITSCFLVINLPILNYVLIEKYNLSKLFYNLFLIVIVIVVLLLQSRTAIIAFAGGLTFEFLFYNFKSSPTIINRWKYAAIFLLLVIGLSLTFYKQGSTYGRLLLWEIALDKSIDNFWSGIGLGQLSYHMPVWQIDYFKTNALIKDSYIRNADESYLIYNEYLELFVEVGLIGITVALLFVYWFFKNRINQGALLTTRSKQSFIAILFCALTSYPLHCNYVLFLLAVYTAIKIKEGDIKIQYTNYRKVLLLSWCFLILVESFSYCLSIQKWNKIVYSTMSRTRKKQEYLEVFAKLKFNGKFLINYGEFLAMDELDADRAIKVLEKSKRYFTSSQTYQSLEILYNKKGEYGKAIHNLTNLTFLVPNRFYPKYRLARLHLKVKNLKHAKSILRQIIAMPMKMKSLEVEQIKDNSALLLDSILANSVD